MPDPGPSLLNEVVVREELPDPFDIKSLRLQPEDLARLSRRARTPKPLDPGAVLAAVERMSPDQRDRLAALLGLPARSEFLWTPGTGGGFVAPGGAAGPAV